MVEPPVVTTQVHTRLAPLVHTRLEPVVGLHVPPVVHHTVALVVPVAESVAPVVPM